MVIGQHPDGRIFLMAHENGVPAMVKRNDKWEFKQLSFREKKEIMPVYDSELRFKLLDEAEKTLDSIYLKISDEIKRFKSECRCTCVRPKDKSGKDRLGVVIVRRNCPEHSWMLD